MVEFSPAGRNLNGSPELRVRWDRVTFLVTGAAIWLVLVVAAATALSRLNFHIP